MGLEEKLYGLVKYVCANNVKGFRVHKGNILDCRFYNKEYRYIVYHIDGYCFEVGFFKRYDTETGEHLNDEYEFDDCAKFDGFKEITIDKAIELIEKGLAIDINTLNK